jgi:hypothetical protein
MRNDVGLVISFLAIGHLAGCAIDDSVVPPPSGSGGGATAGPGTSTSSAGGKAGASSITSAGASGGKGGSAGAGGRGVGGAGAGGTGVGGASTGGAAGNAGAGGAMDDGAAPESGPPDAGGEETCVPETDTALCTRVHKNCGSFIGVDNCGVSRSVLGCGLCLGDGAVCGSAGTLNVCPGTDPVNRAQGGMVLSTNPTSPPMFATEGDLKAFDNDINTKWYVRGNPTPSIAYHFGGTKSYVITSYTITSGNDAPDRDPLSWRLEGSNSQNLTTWTTVDTRTNETFANRGQTNYYSFPNTNGYIIYRLVVTANNGNLNFGGEFQVAEIQLFGDPTPVDAGTGTDASSGGGDAATEAAPDASID